MSENLYIDRFTDACNLVVFNFLYWIAPVTYGRMGPSQSVLYADLFVVFFKYIQFIVQTPDLQ